MTSDFKIGKLYKIINWHDVADLEGKVNANKPVLLLDVKPTQYWNVFRVTGLVSLHSGMIVPKTFKIYTSGLVEC